jgi:hypothetical protein
MGGRGWAALLARRRARFFKAPPSPYALAIVRHPTHPPPQTTPTPPFISPPPPSPPRSLSPPAEFVKTLKATAMGALIMGVIAFVVKIVHIPVTQMLVSSGASN